MYIYTYIYIYIYIYIYTHSIYTYVLVGYCKRFRSVALPGTPFAVCSSQPVSSIPDNRCQ